eukprot:581309-Pleurochrysis_carterae.AAC.1
MGLEATARAQCTPHASRVRRVTMRRLTALAHGERKAVLEHAHACKRGAVRSVRSTSGAMMIALIVAPIS